MPGLAISLRAFDIDQLQEIARFWGLEITGSSKESLRLSLELEMNDPERFQTVFDALSEPAQSALADLKANQGQLSLFSFSQRYGEIRAMGPARRKKEEPWAFPASISEELWYRGLIGRDFLREGDDLEEKIYLPDEFSAILPEPDLTFSAGLELQAQRLILPEPKAATSILNDICSFLASVRFEDQQSQLLKLNKNADHWQLISKLSRAISFLNANNEPTDQARQFLEMSRVQALTYLQKQWLSSTNFNEFFFLPDLTIESDEPVDLVNARRNLQDLFSTLPLRQWYSLDELVEKVYEINPEFLRKQEQFYTWKIHVSGSPAQPDGPESWNNVEGALIRFVLTVMYPLLGLAAVTNLAEEPDQIYFQLFPAPTLSEQFPSLFEEEKFLLVQTSATIIMTNRSPLILRYQISRFCQWLSYAKGNYHYELTPASLKRAEEQGLLPKHLIALLRKHSQNGLPPNLYEALLRWQNEGKQAGLEHVIVLRLANPEMLQALRSGPAGRYLGEAFGPTSVAVKANGIRAVRQALAQLAYLSDYDEGLSDDENK